MNRQKGTYLVRLARPDEVHRIREIENDGAKHGDQSSPQSQPGEERVGDKADEREDEKDRRARHKNARRTHERGNQCGLIQTEASTANSRCQRYGSRRMRCCRARFQTRYRSLRHDG